MMQRNLLVYKHVWMVIFTGFFEPLFYLLGIGLGLGAMVPDIGDMSYVAFVTPGLLAANCMNGAVHDGFFNVHFKLHVQKTYDGILATPMGVPDVVCGEALWALSRGSLYAAAYLIIVFVLGGALGQPMLLSGWAVLALPAAILVAASFAAMALCLTTFVQRVEQFDVVMGLLVMPMFLLSGTFFPVSRFPDSIEWMVQVVPLYHAVALIRQFTTGTIEPSLAAHVVFLIAAGTGAFMVAVRRLDRVLIK